MWPMGYSQVWRAEHEQSASERRAADEQSGRLAADLSHIWLATAELVSALVTQTGRLRRQRRLGNLAKTPPAGLGRARSDRTGTLSRPLGHPGGRMPNRLGQGPGPTGCSQDRGHRVVARVSRPS
jgi:hypothetical protein